MLIHLRHHALLQQWRLKVCNSSSLLHVLACSTTIFRFTSFEDIASVFTFKHDLVFALVVPSSNFICTQTNWELWY
jgi:hypothetical protein